ncbi:hypothetical protein HPB52_020846 [Rhipicephalus sanguineus]|uniref:THAP-type domain-containing protein n=1 Tax=Rhipicephalus sanguineus TaxID=34632 RepID=A0A9D4STG2_RHISA|nr:hypothetical protein HPB52_020846 [Rhipicephalus sanguineus]
MVGTARSRLPASRARLVSQRCCYNVDLTPSAACSSDEHFSSPRGGRQPMHGSEFNSHAKDFVHLVYGPSLRRRSQLYSLCKARDGGILSQGYRILRFSRLPLRADILHGRTYTNTPLATGLLCCKSQSAEKRGSTSCAAVEAETRLPPSGVCSRHFTPDAYTCSIQWMADFGLSTRNVRLKSDAVPALCHPAVTARHDAFQGRGKRDCRDNNLKRVGDPEVRAPAEVSAATCRDAERHDMEASIKKRLRRDPEDGGS